MELPAKPQPADTAYGAIPAGGLSAALERDFGSIDDWIRDFKTLAQGLERASGRVILAWSSREARLVNHAIKDGARLPAGASTLLALDLSEQTQLRGVGSGAPATIGARIAQVRWDSAALAYAGAIETASVGLEILPVEAASIRGRAAMLDVRRRPIYELAGEQIPESEWRDPTMARRWAAELDPTQAVIVYCVHGHEVSQSVALTLRQSGIPARYLAGGVEGWKNAGLPIEHKQR